MTVHDFLDDDLRDQATLFVLDSLAENEARAYRLHLKHCDPCRHEVDSLARTARDLALLAPALTPPAGLFDRVLERIRKTDARTRPVADSNATKAEATQIWKTWAKRTGPSANPDFTFLDANEGEFEPTAVPGIEARRLFVDPENDRATMLVRMAPGTAYPPHVHGGLEECFVIAGDLSVGEKRMKAGDFQRAETGSTHVVQSTEKGCVLLIVSSLHDELL